MDDLDALLAEVEGDKFKGKRESIDSLVESITLSTQSSANAPRSQGYSTNYSEEYIEAPVQPQRIQIQTVRPAAPAQSYQVPHEPGLCGFLPFRLPCLVWDFSAAADVPVRNQHPAAQEPPRVQAKASTSMMAENIVEKGVAPNLHMPVLSTFESK